jgi:hypothetical protein
MLDSEISKVCTVSIHYSQNPSETFWVQTKLYVLGTKKTTRTLRKVSKRRNTPEKGDEEGYTPLTQHKHRVFDTDARGIHGPGC